MSGEMAKNKAYSNNEKLSKKQFVSTYGSLIGLIRLNARVIATRVYHVKYKVF